MTIRVSAGIIDLIALICFHLQRAAARPALSAPPLAAEQLDRLLAPVALYPDPLLAQILMAATYPLEVVEADRWLQVAANAALAGDDLTAALEQQHKVADCAPRPAHDEPPHAPACEFLGHRDGKPL
jgi:hypothetical protein